MLTVAVKTNASALANDKACYVYLFGSEDGTVYNGSSAEAPGTDVDGEKRLDACPQVRVAVAGSVEVCGTVVG